MRMLCSPRLVLRLMLFSLLAGIALGLWLSGALAQ